MKWIIFTNGNPAQLHALLESAEKHMPNTIPRVLLDANDPALPMYFKLAKRFRMWSDVFFGDFRAALLEVALQVRPNGTLEPTTLLTSESMLFVGPFNTRDPWCAFRDRSITGLSLCLSPDDAQRSGYLAKRKYFTGAPSSLHAWRRRDEADPRPTLGTVYRSSDLCGALCRSEWDSTCTLLEALREAPWLLSGTEMGCLAVASLVDIEIDDPDAAAKYASDEVIDTSKLREDQTRYHWKRYEG